MDTLMIAGICRCCASEGPSKDLTSTYCWMGNQEVYSKMLLDCFDISLLMEEESNNGGICEVCITQLRNAFQFKKQVQLTEDKFKKTIRSGTVTAIKLELVSDDASDSEPEMHEEHLDDSIIAEDFKVPIKRESSAEVEEVVPKKRARASTSKAALKSEPNLSNLQAWVADTESKEGACYLKRLTNDGGEYFHCYPESCLGHVKAPSKSTCPARIEIKHASELWMVTHRTKHLSDMTTGQTETCKKKSKATSI